MKILLLGAGNSRKIRLQHSDEQRVAEIVTLDFDPNCKPDVWHDLNYMPLPFKDNEFDQIHAYEVLEHIGRQGEWKKFFEEFSEYWRVLKPGGRLCGTSPSVGSRWLWGDPGHTRVISPECFVFLSQAEYKKQVGHTPITDYRHIYSADFEPLWLKDDGESFSFILEAMKGNTDG